MPRGLLLCLNNTLRSYEKKNVNTILETILNCKHRAETVSCSKAQVQELRHLQRLVIADQSG